MIVEIACSCDDLPAHSHTYRLIEDNGSHRYVSDQYDVRIWVDWKTIAREYVLDSRDANLPFCVWCPDREACSQGACHLNGGPNHPEGD